jgi:AbrB family looped-hinge helix DNA binding protein
VAEVGKISDDSSDASDLDTTAVTARCSGPLKARERICIRRLGFKMWRSFLDARLKGDTIVGISNFTNRAVAVGELVRVKDKFQVTIPVEVRTAVAIREGDYLEVSAVPDGVLFRPRRVVSPGQSVRTILDFLREAHGPGRSKAEIDAQLDAQRSEW